MAGPGSGKCAPSRSPFDTRVRWPPRRRSSGSAEMPIRRRLASLEAAGCERRRSKPCPVPAAAIDGCPDRERHPLECGFRSARPPPRHGPQIDKADRRPLMGFVRHAGSILGLRGRSLEPPSARPDRSPATRLLRQGASRTVDGTFERRTVGGFSAGRKKRSAGDARVSGRRPSPPVPSDRRPAWLALA